MIIITLNTIACMAVVLASILILAMLERRRPKGWPRSVRDFHIHRHRLHGCRNRQYIMSDGFVEYYEEEATRSDSFQLRSYQREWKANTKRDREAGFTRLLLDAVGGSGKSTYFADLAKTEWEEKGARTLILQNRQQLVTQTAQRIEKETGLEAAIEMGSDTASPHAPIVVACDASIGRVNRLTSWADNHFGLVISDEAHHSLAPQRLRTMSYFHWGAEALSDGWVPAPDGKYVPKAHLIGTTATPDIHGRRNLGEIFQKFTARYSYLQAIEDGWLVGVREENIPVQIDTRKFRTKTSSHGKDFSAEDEAEAILPIIDKLSEQIVLLARNRKTMAFLPSLECARLMSEALNRKGLKSLFVSGECLEKNEKTDYFQKHGPGICLCLCALYVEGTDFPDVDTVAWMRATISPAFYKQGVYRLSRTLPGIVFDWMTPEQRRAAIASSSKPYGLLISPFFISDRVDLCSVVDLFVDKPELKAKIKKAPSDMTDAAKIRDFIEALEKAADKHRNKQPRTIDPVIYSLSIGEGRINAMPSEDATPPLRAELDALLSFGIDTTKVKNSEQAQRLISTLRERDRLGLASPKSITQLRLNLGWPEELATKMKQSQAGMIIGKRIRYRSPAISHTSS